MISNHTRKYLKEEIWFPGPAIDRANRSRWHEEGSKTIGERAHGEVLRITNMGGQSSLDTTARKELHSLMRAEAIRFGMDKLPETD